MEEKDAVELVEGLMSGNELTEDQKRNLELLDKMLQDVNYYTFDTLAQPNPRTSLDYKGDKNPPARVLFTRDSDTGMGITVSNPARKLKKQKAEQRRMDIKELKRERSLSNN